MKRRDIVRTLFASVLFGALLLPATARAQNYVVVGQVMPEFTLPAWQGGEWSPAQARGKNVLLVFPRGLAGQDWCHICNYQYAELAELDRTEGLRTRYDLEVVFVLPYDRDMVQAWVDDFAPQLEDIHNWKNPADPASLDERGRSRMERYRALFPKEFRYAPGEVPLPFPLLVDADRSVSRRLGLFTEDWNGAQVPQNIPTIYLLDREGTVRFKYHSQSTVDRPGADYLVRFIQRMMMGRPGR
jgi:peroxiredoxin